MAVGEVGIVFPRKRSYPGMLVARIEAAALSLHAWQIAAKVLKTPLPDVVAINPNTKLQPPSFLYAYYSPASHDNRKVRALTNRVQELA